MSKDERKAEVEKVAKKFRVLDAEQQARIVGYLDGVRDEREKWIKKEQQALQTN